MITESAEQQGFDAERLERVEGILTRDIDTGRYDGMHLVVRRRGAVVLDTQSGWADRTAGVPLDGQVICAMSLAKAMTAVVLLQQVERGLVSLTAPVAEYIPSFGANGKARVTISQMLTHTAGMPFGRPPGIDVGDLAAVTSYACSVTPESRPGESVSYSSTIGYAVLGEIARRVSDRERSFRDMMREDLFEPLSMSSTAFGLPEPLSSRFAPVVMRNSDGPSLIPGQALEAHNVMLRRQGEYPAGGAVSTATDLMRFAEALRLGGALDGSRILSPTMTRLATRIHTGAMINRAFSTYQSEVHGVLPSAANLGLGFFVRGESLGSPPFGAMNSAGTFGAMGAGSVLLWVDPLLHVSFVAMSTGVMETYAGFRRFERISDAVIGSIVDL